MLLSDNILKYGQDEELPSAISLRAGALTMSYLDGFLRYIKLGDIEVLRMINHLVRDQNWDTIPQVIYDEDINIMEDRFTITYKCRAREHAVDFLWDCQINGTAESKLTFKIKGRALKSFKRNRIGFTVLHPNLDCRGKSVTILHSDGAEEHTLFPELISPHQPFMDVKGMTWKLGRAEAQLDFLGEVFETEDQRNWTDDSYKTYCTPLDLPFPKEVKKDEKISQQVILTVLNTDGNELQNADDTVSIEVDPKSFSLPRIGITKSSQPNLSKHQVEQLRRIPFDHYQVDLRLFDENWHSVLQSSIDESISLGWKLELSLFFMNTSEELESFLRFVRDGNQLAELVDIINVFDFQQAVTSENTLSLTLDKLKVIFPDSLIGSGTNAFFTELNRNRISHSALDHLVYSINPQVHAFDNPSLVETLYAQADTVATAHSFSSGRDIHISPVTFKMRWNPNATEIEERSDPLINSDSRQGSLFGAAWTLGSIQNLLASEVASITYFETTGYKGIISNNNLMENSELEITEVLYPVYHLFEYILARKNCRFQVIQCKQPLSIGGIVVDKTQLVLVNYTNNTLKVHLPQEFHKAEGYSLSTDNVEGIMLGHQRVSELGGDLTTSFIELKPYAIAFYHK